MKFLRVEVDNWRPFRGTSAMNIAATDKQPITLVFGKNGGGKTSLLTAIYWCLYKKTDLEADKGDQNLVNDHAVQDLGATKDNPATATVTLYASHTRSETTFLYRVQRSQRAYETNGKRTEASGGLIVERIEPPEGYVPGDNLAALWRNHAPESHFENDDAQLVIEELLAEGLAKYFFYPGETLSFPFKGDKHSRAQLQEFLREISGRSKFRPFSDTISEACKTLDAQSKSHADANARTQSLQTEIDELKDELATAMRRSPEALDELDAAEAIREAVDAQLSSLNAFKEVLAAEKTASVRVEAARKAVELAEESLSEALGRAYLCVASPIFASVREVYGRRPYPSDISHTLVEQLQADNMCICGRELEPGMLQEIEPRSPADRSVDSRMLSLLGDVSRLTVTSTQTDVVDNARVALYEAVESRSKALEAHSAAEERVKERGADEFGGVDEGNLVATRQESQKVIDALGREIGGLEVTEERINKQITAKEAEKRAAAPTTDKVVHRAAQIADEMNSMIEDIRTKQAGVAREQLEQLIQDNYVIYKTNLNASIDSEYRVQIHEARGDGHLRKQVGDLSSSETALLTYAFAAAAARLIPQYQNLDRLLTTIPDFEEVEPIPLVVDAPFTNLGPEYKRRVMDLMARGFSQVIMFTESVDIDVLEDAADKIGAEYLVRFEGSLDSVENRFDWRGSTYEYAVPNSEEVKSTLESIRGRR